MSAVLNPANPGLDKAWRSALLALALLVLAIVLFYWDTWVAMVSIWDRSGTFAHCFLVLPISLWLVWRKREELLSLTPVPQPWVLLPMLVCALAWLLGDLASVNALTQFAVTALLVLSVPLVMGLGIARRITFPLAFLFFMVPFGEFMLPVLMDWTADFTVAAIAFSGIPVYREGLQFVIPTGSWSVVDACSGVRYLIASFMVGSLFAYLNYSTTRRRVIFCLISIAVPLAANWLRAYMIVMLGHLSGNKIAVGVDHLIYGWVFFGVVIGIMFFIGARWSEPPAESKPGQALQGQARAGRGPSPWLACILGVLVLSAPHAVAWRSDLGQMASASAGPFALPALSGTSEVAALPAFQPQLQNPTTTALKGYAQGDGVVYVHLAYYKEQRYGSKLVTSDNSLLRGQNDHWQEVRWMLMARPGDAREVQWRSAELLGGSVASTSARRQRIEVRQAYWVDGHLTASGPRATLYGLRAKLAGRGDSGALLTVYTEGEDKRQTSARLDAFLDAHIAALERQLVTYQTLP